MKTTNSNRARLALAAVVFAWAFAASGADREVSVVRTSDELFAAMADANTERTVRLRRGTYAIDRPLTVPDGITVVGEGVMRFDESGLPLGFEPGTETTIRVTSGFTGDLLTLGNGAGIHNLKLEDLADDPGSVTRRVGNVVVVASRSPGDLVAASIVECEIFNPNRNDFDAEGPTGYALAVFTRNRGQQLPPPPDEGATLRVRMERTVVHATKDAGALFVINFAARARTTVALSHNRVEGRFVAVGGTSRPDAVTQAKTTIRSNHNVFISPSGDDRPRGWTLFASSSSPHTDAIESGEPAFNTLYVRSVADRIEGFVVGIFAAAARRILAGSGPVSDNLLDIDLKGLRIQTGGVGAADLLLYATFAEPNPDAAREFLVGDRNTLRIRMDNASGSGARANLYAPYSGPLLPANFGADNRIEIVGDPAEFVRSNAGFEPLPPPEYFVGEP